MRGGAEFKSRGAGGALAFPARPSRLTPRPVRTHALEGEHAAHSTTPRAAPTVTFLLREMGALSDASGARPRVICRRG